MVKMAQYGTKHGHAAGVLSVMLASVDVEVAGVYEPDLGRRRELETSGVPPWSDVRWFADPRDFLEDPTVAAVAAEGLNRESLDHVEQIVEAGKHVFYDKPAGDDFGRFERIVARAGAKGLLVQMGYMFRYHDGFERIADWTRSGRFGPVFSVRAHMSTHVSSDQRATIGHHRGGIFYDLAGHMIDQIVWLLGRPDRVTSFLQRSVSSAGGGADNTVAVFEFAKAIASVDIAAMEPRPSARRFEVYGTKASAIMEPFEPARAIRLCCEEPFGGFPVGVTNLVIVDRTRYVASLAAFVKDIHGKKKPDRSLEHELLVQETLLRATGSLPD